MSQEHALLTARDIHGPFMQMLTNLQGDNGREWLEILKKVNRRENPFPASLANSASTRGLSQGFLTAEAFVIRPGRYVYDSFKNRITPAYLNRLRRRSIKKVKYFDLTERSYDKKDIIPRPEMGGMEKVRKHAFTPDQIDTLMLLQPHGPKSPGVLLTDDKANIFYMIGVGGELVVVYVYWYDGKWYVNAYSLDEHGRWNAGRRVFRNT